MTMLRKEVIDALDALDCADDPEAAHGKADDLLLDYVPPEVAGAYLRVVRRCTWWGTS